MEYFSVKEVSVQWGVSERWIQKLCEDGRIEKVQRFGRSWMIPMTATKPNDLRRTDKGK
jgi:excisionase family DNA binding protein